MHVLFLKGPVVQDETPEHWVDHYASFGVQLHYLEMPDRSRLGGRRDLAAPLRRGLRVAA